MGHVYGKEFMDYAAASSRYAAEKIVHHLKSDLSPRSILDVGCAVGAWLDVWMQAGVSDVCGVDGDYVNRSQLLIPQDRFRAANLAETIDLGRRYDLVQSLEVGEHITSSAARIFVDSIARHAERYVLFAAAPPGQGGEHHVNERPYDYWRGLLAGHGFVPFDFVRPLIAADSRVSYWYRYNVILYVRRQYIESLPKNVSRTRVHDDSPIKDISPLLFKIRKAAVRLMPLRVQHNLARLKAQFLPTGRI